MFRVEKQGNDEQGPHRWSRVGKPLPTRGDAEMAVREAARASLEGPHPEGYRTTKFRVVHVLGAVAAIVCMVLQ